MKVHKASRYSKAMDKVISNFIVGQSYTNRKGTYNVKSIADRLMTVRYEGEHTNTVLNLDNQRQIIFAIADDTAVFVKWDTWITPVRGRIYCG